MQKTAKRNGSGRIIGQDHPRAKLTDHEVELIQELLDDRQLLLDRLAFENADPVRIQTVLVTAGLSLRCIAVKFEVHRSCIVKIARGERRCQTPSVE